MHLDFRWKCSVLLDFLFLFFGIHLQVIPNITRKLHDGMVKCEVHNAVGKSEESEALDISCKCCFHVNLHSGCAQIEFCPLMCISFFQMDQCSKVNRNQWKPIMVQISHCAVMWFPIHRQTFSGFMSQMIK